MVKRRSEGESSLQPVDFAVAGCFKSFHKQVRLFLQLVLMVRGGKRHDATPFLKHRHEKINS